MELRQLEYVLAVAREGSFTRAAERLFVSQSSLSKRIAKLEEELGCLLFLRGKREVCLTESGRAVAQAAPGIVDAWNSLRAGLSRNTLTLAVTPVLAHYGLSGRLTRFTREHPEVRLQMAEYENAEIPALLAGGRAELAIFRRDEAPGVPLRTLTLCTDELMLLLPRAHPDSGGEPVSLSRFAREKVLLLGGGTHLQTMISRAFTRVGSSPDILFEGSNADTIRDLVADGAGISILLGQVARRLAGIDARLAAVPFLETCPVEIVLAARRGVPLSPQARTLWRYLTPSAAAPPNR